MRPDRPIDPKPAGHFSHPEPVWERAERDYRDGWSAQQVCDRYGLGLTAFKGRARDGGWRRCDREDPDPLLDDDPEADEPIDCAALAEDALIRVRRALRRGRAAEAASWMRLHEKLLARLEAAEAQARRRERVAREQGADGATARALAPLRDQQAILRGAASTHLRLTRAFKAGQLVGADYHDLCELNDEVVAGLRRTFPQSCPQSFDPVTGPTCPTTDFSAAPDP
ncbi:MAG: hypothetical protein REJ23_02790 [Brevundimonas sp.]|nr:hypothetical protein [Brevundimonas sp.]